MKELLQQLAADYDHILIDSPPLINLADPIVLSMLADGVILVVRGGTSNRAAVRAARQGLESIGARILGVVLNDVDLRAGNYGYYHSSAYGSRYYRQAS
jgi:Mrp family chromosome partitioning ATPase